MTRRARSSASSPGRTTEAVTPNRIASAAGAAVFAIVGGWGLVVSLDPEVDPAVGPLVAGLVGTSVVLAVLHLVLAAALAVGAFRGERLARPVNVAVGTVLLLVGLCGLFAVGTPVNVLALNGAANLLHFAASSALLATGLGASRTDATPPRRAARASAHLQSDIN